MLKSNGNSEAGDEKEYEDQVVIDEEVELFDENKSGSGNNEMLID